MSKTPEIQRRDAPSIGPRATGLESQRVEPDVPVQDVDHSRVAKTGIALDNARGIELDPFTPNTKKLFEDERFMAERIEVMLADPGNEDEHQFAEITVNGERVCIRRGETGIMKRCHLAVLAGAKTQRLVQTKITNPDGSMGYQEKFVLRPIYPFQVVNDPNPKGALWLRQLLQQA